MARLGVTYQDIENAANQLSAQGKQPTIELIRQFLGTGSSTTIAGHLRKWRSQQDGILHLASTENLPKEMITTMKGLWQQLCASAESKITANELKYQQEILALQQEVQKYKTNNQRWQQLFNQWQQEKEKLTAHQTALEQGTLSLQQAYAVLQATFQAQTEQLQEKQARIEELHRLQLQAQANLEHYRETSREQRLMELQQFEEQKHMLLSETKALTKEIISLKEKYQTAQQDYQMSQQAHKILEQSFLEATAKLEKQQAMIMDMQNMKNELDYASRHWQKLYEEMQASDEAKRAELVHILAENKMLTKQVNDVNLQIQAVKDQNKLLGHEKWILMQEKAKLEGVLSELTMVK